jgi:propanol-preferring alcohol dehydrogenase
LIVEKLKTSLGAEKEASKLLLFKKPAKTGPLISNKTVSFFKKRNLFMKAMLLKEHCEIAIEGEVRKNPHLPYKKEPLEPAELPLPVPAAKQIRIKITACGICHTELDEIEGRLSPPSFPLVLGHEIVGRVESLGPNTKRFKIGERVGIAWIHSSCGKCKFCQNHQENLCDQFQATGLHAPGGYAQYTVVSEDFAYPIPAAFSDSEAAPLLCAGVIGFRALRLTNIKPGQILGLYGFGASAHIAIQIAKYWDCRVFVFTRPDQQAHQNLARQLGAEWVGVTGDNPPAKLDCAIDFTPVGEPVAAALKVLEKGGRVVVNAIRKINPIPALAYTEYL